jgi:hypothetical protein
MQHFQSAKANWVAFLSRPVRVCLDKVLEAPYNSVAMKYVSQQMTMIAPVSVTA